MEKLSREDRLALLNSEVYQELEAAELRKQAQTLSDKIVNSPTAQQAIRDGIAKALENKDDDGDMPEHPEHEDIKANLHKLDDHTLYEFCQMFQEEAERRGLDAENYEEEFEDEEAEEKPADEEKEEEEMQDVFAYVKSTLTKIAYTAADEGNVEAAYIIERAIDSLK